MHWSTLNKPDENVNPVETEEIMRKEKLRFEALWELFYAEITYLIDHILVLQNVSTFKTRSLHHGTIWITVPWLFHGYTSLKKLVDVNESLLIFFTESTRK